MKRTIALLFMLTFPIIHAQYHEGTVYFKGDSTSQGFIRVKTFDGIKIKPKKDAEPIDYDREQIQGYDVKGWQYRYVKKKPGAMPKLYKLILDGKVSLYADTPKSPSHLIADSPPNSVSIMINPYEIYYLKIEDMLYKVVNILKKKHMEAFKDCPLLIEKIENNEFKKWEVYDIVEFYNYDCQP
ncbi:hypothetical protein H7U19_15940 [Hyunsoonleella sp. SJ7]|uniref:Uncharacterized protein n=1 Tax=Hyunsoonleella aquatilis TaxID=2762758 RepID=A0A923HC78_9FLAO|nr:hypothetical protein [Hyunsoonleella aquatilis]MBC3759904.1 hypothetical protein [Hyunsoonleella aquatilis]